MNLRHTSLLLALCACFSTSSAIAAGHMSTEKAPSFPLQPLAEKAGEITVAGTEGKVFYVPSTLETIKWGYLPNASDKPVLTVPSGATVVVDT
jgi:hypothetical protein